MLNGEDEAPRMTIDEIVRNRPKRRGRSPKVREQGVRAVAEALPPGSWRTCAVPRKRGQCRQLPPRRASPCCNS